MANLQTVSITHMVKGARLVIGRAFYEAYLFILTYCEHDYILSAAFMVTYRVTLSMGEGYAKLGVAKHEQMAPPRPGTRDPDYQRVQVHYKGWHKCLGIA